MTKLLAKFKGLYFAEIGKADKKSEKMTFRNVNVEAGTQSSNFSSIPAGGVIVVVVDVPLEKLAKTTTVVEDIMSE